MARIVELTKSICAKKKPKLLRLGIIGNIRKKLFHNFKKEISTISELTTILVFTLPYSNNQHLEIPT